MDCPQCGYVMDPFEKECLRCARQGAQAASVGTVATQQMEDREVAAAIEKIAPKVQARLTRAQANALQPIPTGPALGWPLTILLWFHAVVFGGSLLYFASGMIITRSVMHMRTPPDQFGGVAGPILIVFSTKMLLYSIAMLCRMSWGIKGFTITTAVALIMVCFCVIGAISSTAIFALVPLIPAVATCVLAIMKFDEFD